MRRSIPATLIFLCSFISIAVSQTQLGIPGGIQRSMFTVSGTTVSLLSGYTFSGSSIYFNRSGGTISPNTAADTVSAAYVKATTGFLGGTGSFSTVTPTGTTGQQGWFTRGTAPNSGTVRVSTTTDTVRVGALISDGNVGIGTTAPGAKLSVAGTVQITSLSNPTSGAGLEMGYDGTEGIIQAYDRGTDDGKPLWLNYGIGNVILGGNVGIGTTTPLTKTDITGTLRSTDTLRVGTWAAGNFTWITATKAYFGGDVGVGISATAALHLKAGTATANTAPLKLTSGTLLTTAEAGAVEFLTDKFYGTITTGAARKQFAFLESVSARVTNSGVQSLASTGTIATWNTIDHETGGELWDAGTPTRLTAPITGTYVVVADIAAESDAVGQIAILKNGALAHNGTTPRFWTGSGSTTAIVQLTAGDYVECRVYPAATVNSIATADRHYFAMTLLK